MNWRLYRKDDPNTYPEIDCPMDACIYVSDGVYLIKIVYYDINANVFYYFECMNRYNVKSDELYYRYIGYIPNGYQTIKTKKCSAYPEKLCEYVDDGYCFDAPDGFNCEFCQEVNEYALNDNLRVWEEFDKK